MATMYGADVDQLRQLASQFDAKAQALDADRMTVGNAIQVSAWVGPVATRFRHTWESDYSRKLHDAATRLRDAAVKLRANADDQERTSAVDAGGRSGGAGGGGASSTGSSTGETVIRVPRLGGETVTITNSTADGDGTTYTTEQDARSGAGGRAGAHAGEDGKGGYEAGVDASGEYGIGTGTEARFDGSVLDGEVGVDNFVGARGGGSAGVQIGPGGASADAGVNAFVGSELGGHGELGAGGVTAGIGASVRAGVGADANVSAGFDGTTFRFKAKIGVALGIGGSVSPSFEISPNEIATNIKNFFKWPH